MTAGGNGDHVTWRELNLALRPIIEKLDTVAADVKALRDDQAERRGEHAFRRWLWPVLIAAVAASSWFPNLLSH